MPEEIARRFCLLMQPTTALVLLLAAVAANGEEIRPLQELTPLLFRSYCFHISAHPLHFCIHPLN